IKGQTPNTGGSTGLDIISRTGLASPPALVCGDLSKSWAGWRVSCMDGELGNVSKVEALEPFLDLRRVNWRNSVHWREGRSIELALSSSNSGKDGKNC